MCYLHQGRSEGLPPPHGDQQEDLQNRRGIQDEGRQAGQEQRRHRVRFVLHWAQLLLKKPESFRF